MKNRIVKLFFLVSILCAYSAQSQSNDKNYYNKEFKWKITIPETFVSVSPDEWGKMQNRGASAVEKTYGEKIVNRTETIFAFKNGNFNYFESNFQPFDPAIDGNYKDTYKAVNELIYGTLKTQMPNAAIKTFSSTQNIGGLTFFKYDIKIEYQNGITMHTLMYSRLFDKKEFSVNIIYIDEHLGKLMIDSWINSKFE